MKKIKKSYIRLEYINCTNDADIIEAHGNRMVHIYSREHGLYWIGPSGYTKDKTKAYTFTLRQAYGLTKLCGPEKGIEFHFLEKVPQVDTIICPNCGETCQAEVKESFPFNDFTHQCEHCGYWIMESEYETIKNKNDGTTRQSNRDSN